MMTTPNPGLALTGKKVLVTGAGGFIGSHLSELLVSFGARVTAMVHYNSKSSLGWLEYSELIDDVEVVLGDVRDESQCRKIISGKEIVFNLAALIGIPYSYQAPSSYVETNVKGSLNIFEAARAEECCRVIQMSTSEVYGTARYIPMDELHPLHAQSPYSASKVAADALATSYFLSFGAEIVIGRPFNTFGPRQSNRAVIPAIISQLIETDNRISLGNTEAIRDFVFVKDTCRSLCELASCDTTIGEVVNIGTGAGISIRELSKKICNLMGIERDLFVDKQRLRPARSEVDRLVCNSAKLLEHTGYKPELNLEDGLSATIDWHLRRPNRASRSESRYFV